jgi:hypothetical protein
VRLRSAVLAAIGSAILIIGFTVTSTASPPFNIEIGEPRELCGRPNTGSTAFSYFYFDRNTGERLECVIEGSSRTYDSRSSGYFTSQEAQRLEDRARELSRGDGLSADDEQRLDELAQQMAEQKGLQLKPSPSEALIGGILIWIGGPILILGLVLVLIDVAKTRK